MRGIFGAKIQHKLTQCVHIQQVYRLVCPPEHLYTRIHIYISVLEAPQGNNPKWIGLNKLEILLELLHRKFLRITSILHKCQKDEKLRSTMFSFKGLDYLIERYIILCYKGSLYLIASKPGNIASSIPVRYTMLDVARVQTRWC